MSINDLEEVGEVMHLAKSNRIIVRILRTKTKDIRLGEILVDERNKMVGKVAELIGPVVSPYASLFPLTERTNKILGIRLYRRKSTRIKRKS
jgi:RNA-binding protein